jgi:hypothetical protein
MAGLIDMELESLIIGLLAGLLLPFVLPKLATWLKNRKKDAAE